MGRLSLGYRVSTSHAYPYPDTATNMDAAEYVRIPFADNSLIPVPINANTNITTLIDYLFVADIFSTDWTGVTWSGYQAGDSIPIFRARS